VSTFTPEPWSVSDARGVNGEFWVVGGEGFDFGLIAEVISEDDARLIASAPDLLEALKALQLQALQSPDLRRTDWGREALEKTRAAIAKATGQDPLPSGEGG